MTASRRDSSEGTLDRIESAAEQVFSWIDDHRREVLGAIVVFIVVGLATAGAFEWMQRREDAAQLALSQVERTFARSMGGDPALVAPPEPANAAQARRARETALAGYQKVIQEHAGSRASQVAGLRAAAVEADLGQRDAAATRLRALVEQLDPDDALRALALTELGWVEELREDPRAAAESYAEAARVPGNPDPASDWLRAGRSYERAGARDQAVLAYQELLSADPELGERERVSDRISALEATSPTPPAKTSDKKHSVK
ncbi:MAG: tetratricopeptide repeat protein [Myxococcota bacterium]